MRGLCSSVNSSAKIFKKVWPLPSLQFKVYASNQRISSNFDLPQVKGMLEYLG